MSAHALLSPSSAHRWLHCTPAPRLEATLPAKTSVFAEEGTLAHTVCEITAKKYFGKQTDTTIAELKKNELWDDEMLKTAEVYVEHLAEKSMSFKHQPYVTFEVAVSLADYVPESFGRCDCVMFGENRLIITDYKHGKGVPVTANKNPQMQLYALGALTLYKPIFGDEIKQIELCIDQPRLSSYETWTCTTEELLAWGESIKPIAQKAFRGEGDFCSGEWCRFCRANGLCKAQAEQQTSAVADFAGLSPALLSPSEIGDYLKKGENLSSWYDALKQAALDKLLGGEQIEGFKVVEGRSSRAWSNQDEALSKLEASGIEHALIYDSVPKTLAKLEKMIGAAKFTELVGDYVIKPQGKPTLTTAADPRKEFNGAIADFANVKGDN